ncbi:hypothetical protein PO909_025549 [Leuciscus waleckii]
MSKFLEISHEVYWADDVLKTGFWYGLDDHLHQQAPASSSGCDPRHFCPIPGSCAVVEWLNLNRGSSLFFRACSTPFFRVRSTTLSGDRSGTSH